MSGYIKIPRESESKEFTLVAWIKKSFTGEDEVPILQKSTGGNRGYELLVDSYYGTDRLALFVYSDGDGTQRFRTSEQIPSDELTFVAATFDNETGEASLYINEMEQELTSDASPATYDLDENSLLIGASSELSSAKYFNGSIDDVRVYNRKLSGTEIQQLYENRNTDEITNGLFICWPMLFNMASSYSLGFNDLQIEPSIGESTDAGLDSNVNYGYVLEIEVGQSNSQGLQTNIRYGIALTASIATANSISLTPTYHQRVFVYTSIGRGQSNGYNPDIIASSSVTIPVSSISVNINNYCDFSASVPGDDWIAGIHIEDQDGNVLLDISTPNYASDGYRDMTDKVIKTNPGDELTISVTVDSGGGWTQALSWGHDINNQGTLEKTEDLHSASAPYTHTYTWTVPEQPGNYLMSWWEHYNGFDSGCGDHDYAERQDFTLHINDEIIGESISRFYSPSLRIGEGVILTVDEVQKNFSEGLLFNLLAGSSAILQTDIAESISAGLDINIVNNVLDNVNYGDDVYLLVNDANGNVKVYKAVVKERKPQNRRLSVSASLGDSILSERIIKEDYDEQDIGLTAKQIIDTYCAPLTSTNINTNTGITAPIQADGKKPLTVFEKLRREHGIYYYVSFDWNVHLYKENAIEGSNFGGDENRGYKIRLGDE